MGKHTQNCTLIGKGVYGTIGVDQRSRLADGAHFHTMIVTSTLEASVIEGDKLVIKSGIVRCDGDIRVSSISGSGDIEVGGDIICDEITFTGKLRCNGDIVCSGNLSVVPERLRTLDHGRPWRDDQFAACRVSSSRDMSR